MRLQLSGQTVHLTYCLNIHPGESWEENLAAIRHSVPLIRQQVDHDGEFGLGLRLSVLAAGDLDDQELLAAFREELTSSGLYAFTVNAFPFGVFHDAEVKKNVYLPDWRTNERVGYTLRVARILAALLPEGIDGTISTVPGGYRELCADSEPEIAAKLALTVRELARIEAETGRRIQLALEPEPDCLWDTTADCIRLFQQVLPQYIAAEPLWRYLGICLDTCHQAVIGEAPGDSLGQLLEAGISIAKLQVSAAPIFDCSLESLEQAAAFVDPVYLHQSAVRTPDGANHRFPDLPQALEFARDVSPASELRTHFHIPLALESWNAMRSTRQFLDADFWELVRASDIRHIEAETYTFNVLPEALRERPLEANVAAELNWILQQLQGGSHA